MPKPKKIRKRKSFMFSSRHYSMTSIISFAMGVCSLAGLIGAILMSFGAKGNPPVHLGGVGLFAMIGNITGVIAAMNSLNERDIFRWVSYSALGLNMTGMALWTLMVFWGL
ncbi:MAG: hypothetical protein IKP31_02665 [Lachnospiraceae bacterium]|nr:hypothetical protein [Lachnospiraceae bacterium]